MENEYKYEYAEEKIERLTNELAKSLAMQEQLVGIIEMYEDAIEKFKETLKFKELLLKAHRKGIK